MDVTGFRATFPEFGTTPGTGSFTDARIAFWLVLGTTFLQSPRWANFLDHALALFVAHRLCLDKRNADAFAAGGNPGEVKGPLTGRTVHDVTNSYDASSIQFEQAGHWNTTTYGIQFYALLRIAGAGAMEIGPDTDQLLLLPSQI